MPNALTSPRKPITQRALLRTVASSTALATGQSVAALEQQLGKLVQQQRFAHIKLAR
jgi:hypothetical protein